MLDEQNANFAMKMACQSKGGGDKEPPISKSGKIFFKKTYFVAVTKN